MRSEPDQRPPPVSASRRVRLRFRLLDANPLEAELNTSEGVFRRVVDGAAEVVVDAADETMAALPTDLDAYGAGRAIVRREAALTAHGVCAAARHVAIGVETLVVFDARQAVVAYRRRGNQRVAARRPRVFATTYFRTIPADRRLAGRTRKLRTVVVEPSGAKPVELGVFVCGSRAAARE